MYQRSLAIQKQNKIDHICEVMRAGKERKRLAQDYEPRHDRPKLCMQIIVKDFECAEARTVTYYLQACPIRRDSYWIWEGKTRLPKPMGKAQFFRRYLTEHHPRLMPVNI
jgi:hypothetical protein